MSEALRMLPEELRQRFKENRASDEDLRAVRSWLVGERLSGPAEDSRFRSGVWNENLNELSKLVRGMWRERGLGTYDPVSSGVGEGNVERGPRELVEVKEEEGEGCGYAEGTFAEYVWRRCGPDSAEWKRFLEMRKLYGGEEEVVGEEKE